MTPRSPMESVGPEHFGRARTAFEAALECPPAERAAFLERPGTYDVAPDGRRFLVLKQGDGPDQPAAPARVVVVKNWIEELRRLVPSGR